MVNWLQDTNYFNITNAVKENNYVQSAKPIVMKYKTKCD